MNNQSPLIPQGSILEQKNRGRARVRIVVFSVLAIHVMGVLVALLMQGCKQDKPGAGESTDAATATAPPSAAETNPVVAAPTPPGAPSNTTVAATPTPPSAPPVAQPLAPPVAGPQDYVIVQGDNFSGLAKKFGVSSRAIMDANPGVEPTKLQIGQKIHIPAAAATVAASTTPGTGATDASTGEEMYTVKSGDTLSAIARQFGVRVRSLRSANSLATDMIHVGQKLKIPAKTMPTPTITASNVPTDSSPTGSAPPTPRQ
jgi:LysM repeat protein